MPTIFSTSNLIFVGKLEPHAKCQHKDKKERKNAYNSGQYALPATPKASARTSLEPTALRCQLIWFFCYLSKSKILFLKELTIQNWFEFIEYVLNTHN